jgi:NAD(P) transhydrogenase subunit alpha
MVAASDASDSDANDSALNIDTTDDIQAGVVVTHGGEVVHPAVAKLLAAESANQGS